MRRILSLAMMISFVGGTLAACATQPLVTTPRTYQGAGAGAALGAGAGALIDGNNRWRGAVLGGALGAVAGGTLTEISSRAAQDAVAQNQTVAYQTANGSQRVVARPSGRAANGCRVVHERVYQDGKLVQDRSREVC